MAWLLTLACDGCSAPLEMDAEDRQISRDRGIRQTAEEIADEAVEHRGWAKNGRGWGQSWEYRYYCPTCRLARERRSLVPDSQTEHLSRETA